MKGIYERVDKENIEKTTVIQHRKYKQVLHIFLSENANIWKMARNLSQIGLKTCHFDGKYFQVNKALLQNSNKIILNSEIIFKGKIRKWAQNCIECAKKFKTVFYRYEQ